MSGQAVYAKSPRPYNVDTLKNGAKTVAIAGVAEQLSVDSIDCIEVCLQVKETNTGRIYVGGAGIPNDGSAGLMIGIPTLGQTPPNMFISAQNLAQIWINAEVGGEGVNFIYW